MTLAVLPAYRRLHLASHLLALITSKVAQDPQVDHLCLHVHVANEAAIAFYLKNGFSIQEKVTGYYRLNRGVDPPDAYCLVKHLEPVRGMVHVSRLYRYLSG